MVKIPIYALDPDETYDLLLATNISEDIFDWLMQINNFPIAFYDINQENPNTSGILLFERKATSNYLCTEDYSSKLYNFYKFISTTKDYKKNFFSGYGIIPEEIDSYGTMLENATVPYFDKTLFTIINSSQEPIYITYFTDAFTNNSGTYNTFYGINQNEDKLIFTEPNGRVFMRESIKIMPSNSATIDNCLLCSLVVSGSYYQQVRLQVPNHFLYDNFDNIFNDFLNTISLHFPKINKYLSKINYNLGYSQTISIQDMPENINGYASEADYNFVITSLELLNLPIWYHYTALIYADENKPSLGKPISLNFDGQTINFALWQSPINEPKYSERENKRLTIPINEFVTRQPLFTINRGSGYYFTNLGMNPPYNAPANISLSQNFPFYYFLNFIAYTNQNFLGATDKNLIRIEKHPHLYCSPLIDSVINGFPLSGLYDTTINLRFLRDYSFVYWDREQERIYFETVISDLSQENSITGKILGVFFGTDIVLPNTNEWLAYRGLQRYSILSSNGKDYISGNILEDSTVPFIPAQGYTRILSFQDSGSIVFEAWEEEQIYEPTNTISLEQINNIFSTLSTNGESENTFMPDSNRVKQIHAFLFANEFTFDANNKAEINLLIESLIKSFVANQYGALDEHSNAPRSLKINSLTDLIIAIISSAYFRLGLHDLPVKRPDLLSKDIGAIQDIDVNTVLDLDTWYHRNFDALIGKFPVKINIKDSDLIKIGSQELNINVPNISEMLAEMLGLQLQNQGINDLLIQLGLKTLMETASDKSQNFRSFKLLECIADYLGFDSEHKTEEVQFTCNPLLNEEKENKGKDSAYKFIENTKVKLQYESIKEEFTLEQKLEKLLIAAAITRGVHGRKLDLDPDALREKYQGYLDLITKFKDMTDPKPRPEGEKFKEDFDTFLEEAERGFIGNPNTEIDKPYDRPYSQRPRIKEIIQQIDPNNP